MEPGDRVDRFVVEARLGQGGMASVYRVRHTGLGSAHALKVLELLHPSMRGRLVLEGKVQAGLSHPNIVAVTDLVDVNGAPGLILELVPGPSLDVWLQDHTADATTADALFRGVLDGVGHAHRHGLIHRDLKPGNVLLHEVDGRLVPKVADFGIVKLLGDEAVGNQTRTGFAMGTPGYMAPEQIRSAKDVDARADVFALGCILFELWCGRRPFRGDSVFDVLVAIERRDHPRPRDLRPDIPERVEATILACLEPEPERRLASVDAIRGSLGAPAGAPPTPAPPTPAPAVGPATPGPTLHTDALRTGAVTGLVSTAEIVPPAVATPPPASTLPPVVGERPPVPRRQARGMPAWAIVAIVVLVVGFAAVFFFGASFLAAIWVVAAGGTMDTGSY